MSMRYRALVLTTLIFGLTTAAATAFAAIASNNDGPLGPVIHAAVPTLHAVASLAGTLFALCICIGVVAIALGLRRSQL